MTQLLLAEADFFHMLDHARSELPAECCGLLLGRVEAGLGHVRRLVKLRNALASPNEFISEPRDMLAAHKLMRSEDLEILGVYHSHPTSPPVPSQRDIQRNTYPQAVCVIVSLLREPPEVGVWWLGSDDYRPADWSIIPASAG